MSVQVNLLIMSSSFYLSKPVCPRSISSGRSIHSIDVCQRRSNVSPCKLVSPSDVFPSKPILPSNACLSKTARSNKAYSSSIKHVCPSNICPNRSACLSNICLSKPARATTVFPSTSTCPPNLRFLK